MGQLHFHHRPQVADNYDTAREPTPNDAHYRALLAGDSLLPNPRFIPYEPPGSKFRHPDPIGKWFGASSGRNKHPD